MSFGPLRGRILASGITFALRPRGILWVQGPNGSGKSTLLRTILGGGFVGSGSIVRRVPLSKVGFLPQLQNRLFHLPLTLEDVVSLSLRVRRERMISPGLLSEEQLSLGWNTASGGERRRALLTRVLAKDPSLLVLDEPLSHLDEDSYYRVLDAIRDFLSTPGGECQNRAAVVVEHGEVPVPLRSFEVVRVFLGAEGGDHRT